MPEIDGFHFYQKIRETDTRIKQLFNRKWILLRAV